MDELQRDSRRNLLCQCFIAFGLVVDVDRELPFRCVGKGGCVQIIDRNAASLPSLRARCIPGRLPVFSAG